MDYWAVDFTTRAGRRSSGSLRRWAWKTSARHGCRGEELLEFEERWTGAYIFENEWQSFRTRKDRKLELTSVAHTYAKPGRYTAAVKVIDIFGNDTMTLVPVNVS